jgi:hypothetical protein
MDFERLVHEIENDLDLDGDSGRAITPAGCSEHDFAWRHHQPYVGPGDASDDYFENLAAQSQSERD